MIILASQTGASKEFSRGRKRFKPRVAEMVIRGFNDARTETSWPREYDSWEELNQKNYENGRLVAYNVALAGLKCPAHRWPDGRGCNDARQLI